MKFTKGSVVAYENGYELVFTDEADRNEMALAIYQEMEYYLWMRFLNWYDENDIEEVVGIIRENLLTYETKIVED